MTLPSCAPYAGVTRQCPSAVRLCRAVHPREELQLLDVIRLARAREVLQGAGEQVASGEVHVGPRAALGPLHIRGTRQGHGRALSPSTTIRAVFLTPEGTAIIDFANDVTVGFNSGIESETLAVYSAVDSIAANLPSVKRVKILIQGKEADTLDGHIDLTGYFVPDPSRIGNGL